MEIINWRTTTIDLDNYIDNVRMIAHTYTFETLNREIDTYNGGAPQFLLTPGPAYADKWYVILQGYSGNVPGFNMNHGTVHVPLNVDAWTKIALGLNMIWPGFYGQLDAQGEASATFNTYGPQPAAFSLALNFVFIVFQNKGSTPIYASNPIYEIFTAP